MRTDPFGQGLTLYAYCFNNPLALIDPRGLCAASRVKNWTHHYYEYVTHFWKNKRNTEELLEEMRKGGKKIQEFIIGSKPGDIFTLGFSFGLSAIPMGLGFSLDRIVMPNGQSDWFITGGLGLSTPGPSFSIDRGKLWKLDLVKNKDLLFYLSSKEITKGDIEGLSISSNIDIVKGLGIGAEFAIAPLAKSEFNGLEYPAPLITVKGGPRVGLSPGINLFANWTFDIGE